MKQVLAVMDTVAPSVEASAPRYYAAREALRAAIEDAEKPWVKTYAGGQPHYTAPVDAVDINQERVDGTAKREHEQKEWVGLTEDEMRGLYQMATYMDETDYIHMLMMAEAKLKERNNA